MLSEEEKKAIEKLSSEEKIEIQSVLRIFKREGIENFVITRKEYLDTILKLAKKQQEQLETIKEYTHQEIVHYTEDIRDYIDDDKEGNKHIIGELKEDREHWKDIEKILQNKPKEELYMNWWKEGLYE